MAKAAEQQDWSLVIQHLQQLPLEGNSKLLTELEREQAVNLALQVLANADFQQQWEVAKGLAKLGAPAISPLIALLADEEAEIETRWFAGRILSEFNHPAVIIALTKLLRSSEEEELLAMAAQALAKIGPAAVESLRELLYEETSRPLAVQALACIRCTETIAPLLEVVGDPSPQIRAIAIEALGSFHDRRIPPVLIGALKDLSAAVRKEAVIALGMRADLNSQLNLVACLQPLLTDFNQEVCRQAAFALGRMGSHEAAEALFVVLQSPIAPASLKIDAARALSWIETIPALEALEQGLISNDDFVCEEIITLLGRTSSPLLKAKATQILVNFFELSQRSRFERNVSEQETVQQSRIEQALAMSLGELGQPEAISYLVKLAESPQQSVKLHAHAALKKI